MPTNVNTSFSGIEVHDLIEIPGTHGVSFKARVTGTVTYNIDVLVAKQGIGTREPIDSDRTGLTVSTDWEVFTGPVSGIGIEITGGAGSVELEVKSASGR
jgi:hypothetical protein